MAFCYIDICRIILVSTIGGEHTIPQISTYEFVTCKYWIGRIKDSPIVIVHKLNKVIHMYFCCNCSKIVSGAESSSDTLSRQEADGTLPTLSHCNLHSFDTKVMRPQVPHHAHGN